MILGDTDIENFQGRDPDQQKLIDTTIESIKSKRKQKAENKLAKFNKLGIELEGDILSQNKGLETDLHPSVWIRWGSLLKLINNSINEDANENKLLKIAEENNFLDFNLVEIENNIHKETSYNDLAFANGDPSSLPYRSRQKKLSISINPNICLFPENVKSLFPNEDIGDDNPIFDNPRRISNIYFEVSYLLKTFKSQFYTKDEFDEQIENEDFSLGNFLNKIWGDVNNSCANIHNFSVINDFEKNHIIKIIDLNYQKDDNLTDSKLVKLNVLSTNSIVRDFNYDLSIPSALTSTIAIAAQNPDDPESLEEITFAAFNRGIKNRFSKPKSPKTKIKKYPWSNLENVSETSFEKKIRRLKQQRLELETYLQRLKGPNTIEDNLFVQKVIEYNETVNNEEYEIKLGGESFTDYNEIPSGVLSSARTALKFINTTKIELSQYDLNEGTLKTTKKSDISSIIPLKFNIKLDGLSGIVIGNVFKIDTSKLPELYKTNKVGFIVTGESQEINGQDWTTTLTGQAVILPI